FRTSFLAFTGLTFLAVIGALWFGISRLEEIVYVSNSSTNQINFLGVALLIFGLSLPIWILRLLARFWLSAHHQAIDAEQRSTQMKSFLSLTTDEAVDADQRSLMLSALFRPATTGLVKDDGAPEFTLAAILSKMK
ncbi:MAG: DUF6161 domain-containing protein, partial [Acidobacteriota bacterium]